MSNVNKEQNEVATVRVADENVPAIDPKDIKWDELTDMFTNIKDFLANTMKTVQVTGTTFGPLIENNQEIRTAYTGTIQSLVNFSKELVNILAQHSTVTENKENNTHSYNTYTGTVNKEDEQHVQLYVSLVMAYSGIMEKIQSVVETSQSHLLGLINQEVNDQNLGETKVTTPEPEEVDTKQS